MPVEIRELVIQARLKEGDGLGWSTAPGATPVVQRVDSGEGAADGEAASPAPDPEWMEQLVERCLQRMEARLAEKLIR